ncbi:hypothetical protein vseg_016093 [Gypsophila vaccaria]
MARKTNSQRQRDLNLRGRSIIRKPPSAGPETIPLEEGIPTPPIPTSGPSGDDSLRTKNINEITGITALTVEDEEEAVLVISGVETVMEKQSMPKENRATEIIETNPNSESDLLQIEMEDVQEEIAYWHNAVVCFILGANPPPSVIEGFIGRIWTRFNIDKLSFLPNGIFLVRFKSLEMKEQVLQAGHYLFDNKPMIVNPWSEELELHKPEVKSVPVWIQLHGLPIKFWGKSLPKIAGLVGKFIKSDTAT